MKTRGEKDELGRPARKGGRWVTIATFGQLMDAQLCKAALLAGGVRAMLPDEHTLSLNPHYIGAAQGIRVQVLEQDREHALSILEEAERARAVVEEEEREEVNRSDWNDEADRDHEEGPRCPGCGRRYCYNEWSPIQKLIIFILLGFPLIVLKKKWHCRACGNVFEVEKGSGVVESPYRKARGGARRG